MKLFFAIKSIWRKFRELHSIHCFSWKLFVKACWCHEIYFEQSSITKTLISQNFCDKILMWYLNFEIWASRVWTNFLWFWQTSCFARSSSLFYLWHSESEVSAKIITDTLSIVVVARYPKENTICYLVFSFGWRIP